MPFFCGRSCDDQEIVAELLDAADVEASDVGHPARADVADGEFVAAEQCGREVDRVLVDKAGGDQRAFEDRAAFDVDATDATLEEVAERLAGGRGREAR